MNLLQKSTYGKQYRIKNKEKIHLQRKSYRNKNKEKIETSKKLYNNLNQEKIKDYMKKYYINKRDIFLEKSKTQRKINLNRMKEYDKKRQSKIKTIVINHYSNGKNICACCGYSDFNGLTIDHIIPVLRKRNVLNRDLGGVNTYHWLRKNNFPDVFKSYVLIVIA